MTENYRLTEGMLAAEVPSETELRNAVNKILSSQKRSTYKFAFFQSVIDLSQLDERTVFPQSEVFERVAAMYWRCLSNTSMRQVYHHPQYERSGIEEIILPALSRFPGASFADLPAGEIERIGTAVKNSCRRNVLGSSYSNSRGIIFGFSNRQDILELSLSSKSFLAQHAAELSMHIERGWLLMMEQLNPDQFPASFTARIQAVDQELDRLFKKEDIPMRPSIPEANAVPPGTLEQIQSYIERSQAALAEKSELLESAASEFEKELKAVFPDSQQSKLIFQSRVKGPGSLAEKIYRKNYHNKFSDPCELIDHLPDLIGLRIICLLNQQEEAIFHQLEEAYPDPILLDGSEFCKKQGGRIMFDLSGQPQRQKNGQPIYRITCKWALPDNTYINCELQIKSMVHFFWGELDHMLFYKNYSYLISRTFYSQYMQKVEDALSNVNDQLVLLRNQIEKDGDGSQQEIREIASCMLYQHYHADIEKQIKCTVDLREVFDLIVDMHFQNYGNQDANLRKLSQLLHDIPIRSFCPQLLPVVMNERLDRSIFTQEELPLAQRIDHIIKAADVYWVAFVVTYGSHFWDDGNINYSPLLRKICQVLTQMLRNGFIDCVEFLYEELEELYDAFRSAILMGILQAFEENPKLDFFIFSAKLDAVNSVSQEIVQRIQKHLTCENAEACRRNLSSVTLYTHLRISEKLYGTAPQELSSELDALLELEDPFDIGDSQNLPLTEKDAVDFWNEFFPEGGAS